VPGEFVPGAREAFLTSATMALIAFIAAALVLRPDRARAEVPDTEELAVLEAEAA
jgi:hypothetical protein